MPPPRHRATLTEGPVRKTLVLLTLPMVLGILSMVLFNLVDTYFVGRLGTRELAAMSFTFPVVLIVNGLSLGLGAGASAAISRAIGRGDQDEVRRLTTDSLLLAVLLVAMVSAVGLTTIRPIFTALGAPGDLLPLIASYMRIWYWGTVFVVVPMTGNNAIRATGDTRTASGIMLVAVIINLVLDPLLIFGIGPFPRLGLRGAAIATVAARATTFAVSVAVLGASKRMLTLARPRLSELWRSWRQVLWVGIPTAATRIVAPLGAGVVTRLLSTYGAAAVAALGVSQRIEFFASAAVMALSTVVAPFVGQNWGAGRADRVWEGVKISQRLASLWGSLVYVTLAALAVPIARIFNDDPRVIETITLYLRIVGLGYAGFGLVLVSAATMNVLGHPLEAALVTTAQVFVIQVPAALALTRLTDLGPGGVFAATGGSYLITGLAAAIWLRRIIRHDARRLTDPAGAPL